MSMSHRLLAAASFAGVLAASSASAAPIIVDTATNAPLSVATFTNVDAATLGSATQTIGAGITVSFTGGGAFVQGSSPAAYTAPTVANGNGAGFGAGASTPQANGVDTTPYLSTGVGSAILSFAAPTTYLGLLWGSVDGFNSIRFTSLDGTSTVLTAAQVFGSAFDLSGTQSRYVNFTSTSAFTCVVASSTSPSFEFDNVATLVATAAVPEPAAWAMMIVGMGAVGVAMRRGRKVAPRLSYAA